MLFELSEEGITELGFSQRQSTTRWHIKPRTLADSIGIYQVLPPFLGPVIANLIFANEENHAVLDKTVIGPAQLGWLVGVIFWHAAQVLVCTTRQELSHNTEDAEKDVSSRVRWNIAFSQGKLSCLPGVSIAYPIAVTFWSGASGAAYAVLGALMYGLDKDLDTTLLLAKANFVGAAIFPAFMTFGHVIANAFSYGELPLLPPAANYNYCMPFSAFRMLSECVPSLSVPSFSFSFRNCCPPSSCCVRDVQEGIPIDLEAEVNARMQHRVQPSAPLFTPLLDGRSDSDAERESAAKSFTSRVCPKFLAG